MDDIDDISFMHGRTGQSNLKRGIEMKTRNAFCPFGYALLDEEGFSAQTGLKTEVDIDAHNQAGFDADRAFIAAGGAVVRRVGEWLQITNTKGTGRYRGSSVDGCDADDEFVHYLADDVQ